MINFKPSNPRHFAIQYPTHSTHFQELIFLFQEPLIEQITHFLSLLKTIRTNLIFKTHSESIPSASLN